MSLRRSSSLAVALLSLATILLLIPVPLSAQPAPQARVELVPSLCQLIHMLRTNVWQTTTWIMEARGQCITIRNADGGTKHKDPAPQAVYLTGSVSTNSDGSRTLAVRWDGSPLMGLTSVASLAGGAKFHIEGNPAVVQPTATLRLDPDFPGATTGRVTGSMDLAAQLVFEDGTTEVVLPMDFDLSVDSRYSSSIASVNPNLGPLMVFVEPESCFDPDQRDCLLINQSAQTGDPSSAQPTYCYCSDCSKVGDCLELFDKP